MNGYNKSATQKPPQDIQGQIDSTFSILERKFSQEADRNSLYDKIIEWANAKKAGLSEPLE